MKIRTTVFAPMALGLVFAVGAARAAGAQQSAAQPAQEQPAQQQPAQQQQAAATEPTFAGNTGILLVQVKPGQEAAYENLLDKLKESLAKSEKPERKQMAAGWKIFKSADAMNGNTLYVHIVDPVASGQNYLETYALISEVFPSEVQDLYAKTKDAFVAGGLGRLNLTLVKDLGK